MPAMTAAQLLRLYPRAWQRALRRGVSRDRRRRARCGSSRSSTSSLAPSTRGSRRKCAGARAGTTSQGQMSTMHETVEAACGHGEVRLHDTRLVARRGAAPGRDLRLDAIRDLRASSRMAGDRGGLEEPGIPGVSGGVDADDLSQSQPRKAQLVIGGGTVLMLVCGHVATLISICRMLRASRDDCCDRLARVLVRLYPRAWRRALRRRGARSSRGLLASAGATYRDWRRRCE